MSIHRPQRKFGGGQFPSNRDLAVILPLAFAFGFALASLMHRLQQLGP